MFLRTIAQMYPPSCGKLSLLSIIREIMLIPLFRSPDAPIQVKCPQQSCPVYLSQVPQLPPPCHPPPVPSTHILLLSHSSSLFANRSRQSSDSSLVSPWVIRTRVKDAHEKNNLFPTTHWLWTFTKRNDVLLTDVPSPFPFIPPTSYIENLTTALFIWAIFRSSVSIFPFFSIQLISVP